MNDMAMDQRRDEVRRVIAASESWGRKETLIRGVALVGSWSRQAGRLDSDVDLIVLASEPRALLGTNEWHLEFGIVEQVRAEDFGAIQERRLQLPSGLEVEVGIGALSWATVDPIEPGTAEVVGAGCLPVYDPDHLFERLLQAVRGEPSEMA
jgi:predicted nucleotidyltransferase